MQQFGFIMSAPILWHSPIGRRNRNRNGIIWCMSVSSSSERVESIKSDNGRVLILGATGRVGGSAARALVKSCPNVHLVLAGRNREKGAKLAAELGANTEFYQVSIDNAKALAAALDGVDLVVHAAGPFQREEKCTVLEAAISSKTAYIDVCDDRSYSCLAKTFHEKAVAAQVPAITTAGIYPGVSNCMPSAKVSGVL